MKFRQLEFFVAAAEELNTRAEAGRADIGDVRVAGGTGTVEGDATGMLEIRHRDDRTAGRAGIVERQRCIGQMDGRRAGRAGIVERDRSAQGCGTDGRTAGRTGIIERQKRRAGQVDSGGAGV